MENLQNLSTAELDAAIDAQRDITLRARSACNRAIEYKGELFYNGKDTTVVERDCQMFEQAYLAAKKKFDALIGEKMLRDQVFANFLAEETKLHHANFLAEESKLRNAA